MVNKFVVGSLLIALTVVASGCANEKAASTEKTTPTEKTAAGATKNTNNTKYATDTKNGGYPNGNILADVEWVDKNKDKIVILDARSKDYDKGHIPGAISLSTSAVTDPKGTVEGDPYPSEKLTEIFQAAGVNKESTVVIYDDGTALNASRIYYILEYFGHADLKILNGGYPGWLVANKAVQTDKPTPAKGNFVAKLNSQIVCSLNDLKTNLDSKDFVYLDVRSAKEYTGEDLRAKNGGHIPGAVNIEWNQAIKADNGVSTFKSYDELKALFGNLDPNKTIVPYCQTNVRGAHTYFTLKLLGFKNVRPYEGAWAEYGNVEGVKIQK